MLQVTLFAPDITCEHCIATIERTVSGEADARFLSGSIEGRNFAVEVAGGAVLDRIADALAAEGYPLGPALTLDAATSERGAEGGPPVYRITPTDVGAEVNYDCPCGCVAGFAFNRAVADAEPESCCCGRTMLVGRAADGRLRAALTDPDAYRFDIQTLTMPWGQPIEAVLAIPAESAHEAD